MGHNKIYLIYTLGLFLIGLGFFIVGEFNRVEKPVLKDIDAIGKEDEEGEPEDNTAEISADEVEMPEAPDSEPEIEDIALEDETTEETAEGEEGEDGEVEEEEEEEPPIYDGHEEERIEAIKENYIAQEKYDSNRWTIYFSVVFWTLSLVCAILYFTS
ncbi:MAG: hypothetical protein E7302_01970 [Butyrivibrio sp.]|nr:hypothetical protein [Butyrivibrio sp.]